MKTKIHNGEVIIEVTDDGDVSVSGARSVTSTFPVHETKGEKGLFSVTVERGLWEFDVVLRGDKASPLGKARPLALVVDTIGDSDKVKVYAQDGLGDWTVQHTLFPLCASRH